MFFAKLLPREGNFFQLFEEHAGFVLQAAKAFTLLVKHYDDEILRSKYIDEVNKAEHAADRITREVHRQLHATFITPIDREQILQFIDRLDDVADLLQDAAEATALYDVHHANDEIRRLVDLCERCCERLVSVVKLLPTLSGKGVAQAALKICDEIDELESDADRVMRAAMSKLFRQEDDVREILKLKLIYELLESVTDKCEDVSNIVEGIVLENS
ncbi:MAG: DUF47 domain-containing protein [Brachymonas sp.]